MWSRSDCRYGPRSPPTSTPSVQSSPSHCRSSTTLCSDSRVERSKSVSSIRRMKVPPWPRASSQLKSAVRALPTCNCPVGLGANLSLITSLGSRLWASGARKQRDSMHGDRPARAHRIHALVRLPLHAHLARVAGEHAGQVRAKRVNVRNKLRLLCDDDDVDVRYGETRLLHKYHRLAQELETVCALPRRIIVGKVTPDVACSRRTEH